MKKEWMPLVVFVTVVAGMLFGYAAGIHAQQRQRFWASDWSPLGENQNAYMVHDSKIAGACALVIQTHQSPGGSAMTTATVVPWKCE